MGTLNAAYLRCDDEAEVLWRGLIEDRAIEREHGLPFIWVMFGDDEFEPPVEWLQRASTALRSDALWLSYQSVVDSFEFQHWRDGHCVRELVYGAFESERTWERASGVPEVWEAEALFPRQALERELAAATDERQRQRVLHQWAYREIAAGGDRPTLNARECARAVSFHYGLPGWDVTIEPNSPWLFIHRGPLP